MLATVMRTPAEELEAFAQAQELPDGLAPKLSRVQQLLDLVAAGMEQPPASSFWPRLDQALAALAPGIASPPGPVPVAPPAALARVAEAPAPPPRVEVPTFDSGATMAASPDVRPPATPDDFRRELLEERPPDAPRPVAPSDWRPHDPDVEPPQAGQERTVGLGGTDGTRVMKTMTAAAEWPVERLAALTVALARHAATGHPTLDAIQQDLDLPDRGALEVAKRTSRVRLERDPTLRARHEELVEAWSQVSDED